MIEGVSHILFLCGLGFVTVALSVLAALMIRSRFQRFDTLNTVVAGAAVIAALLMMAAGVTMQPAPSSPLLNTLVVQLEAEETGFYVAHHRYESDPAKLAPQIARELKRVKLLTRVDPNGQWLQFDFTARNGATETVKLFPPQS